MQPLGRTCKVTAAGCITSVWQGTKQPSGELQMGIASIAGMEILQSNLWSLQIESIFCNVPDANIPLSSIVCYNTSTPVLV